MRTTVTLDADTEQLVWRRMCERGVSFKRALDDAIREGQRTSATAEPFRSRVASLGEPTVNLDRPLQIVAELEDDDLIPRMRAGS